MSILEIQPLKEAVLLNIFDHLREYDRKEFEAANVTRNRLGSFISPGAYAFLADSDPVAAFGAYDNGATLTVWFCATDRINEFGTVFHAFAKKWIASLETEHFAKPLIVTVWDQHAESLRWLRHLGFIETGIEVGPVQKRFRYMIYRGVS